MSNSLIIIIIPSKTIRKNCKGMFPDFGENPEKTAVAITAQKISYLPLEKEKIEVLILSERKLPLEISSYVNEIVDGKEFIFIGRHQRTEEFDDNFLNATNFPNKKIAYLDFHRVDSNPFYQGLMDLCQLIGSSYSPISLDENIRRLRACFNVDWELEDILKRKHHLLLSGEAIDIPDNVLIVWNEDDFGAKLKQNAGEANVAVSKIEFEKKLKQKKQVLVLAELTWSSHKFSQFYGYEFARELIFTHDALNLSFISCLPRNELQSVNPAAQLMVPVFHHFLLPLAKDAIRLFKFPDFSETKQFIIKNYFLKPDGVVDKLLHDLKKIARTSRKQSILDLVLRVKSYHSILPSDIISYADYVHKTLLEKPSIQHEEIRKLQHNLEDYYESVVAPDQNGSKAKLHPFKLMIIEDNEDDLSKLENGFSRLFQEVKCFRSGQKALQELEQHHSEYGALIVDMELLDAEGNWQDVQGFEIIERVRRYPNLAITMLTGYSKRAVATINDMLAASNVMYLPKYPLFILPPNWSYESFADHLASLIKQNQKFLEGPQNGIWKKGMLQFYFETLSRIDKEKFLTEIHDAVDEFIKTENKDDELIPKKLFNVNTSTFDIEQLKAVLKHRLICLYYQHQEKEWFQFERGLKKYVPFNLSNPKQYLITLLGFSAQCNLEPDGGHKCTIELSNLFPEEEDWLSQFRPQKNEDFSNFIEATKEITTYLTKAESKQINNGFDSISTLADCIPIWQGMVTQLPQQAYDIRVELDSYLENFPEEYENLKLDSDGKKLKPLIEEFLRLTDNFE